MSQSLFSSFHNNICTSQPRNINKTRKQCRRHLMLLLLAFYLLLPVYSYSPPRDISGVCANFDIRQCSTTNMQPTTTRVHCCQTVDVLSLTLAWSDEWGMRSLHTMDAIVERLIELLDLDEGDSSLTTLDASFLHPVRNEIVLSASTSPPPSSFKRGHGLDHQMTHCLSKLIAQIITLACLILLFKLCLNAVRRRKKPATVAILPIAPLRYIPNIPNSKIQT